MSDETREITTWLIGTILGVAAVIGLIVKFVLLPYMREHLVMPMRQVEKQVSQNAHQNTVPTVLDKIDDVQESVNRLQEWVEESRIDRATLHRMFTEHADWSARWVALIEKEIALLNRMQAMEDEDLKNRENE